MEEERREHVMKMKKMETEMEQVFDMKVKEKKQKLKDSEAEVGSESVCVCVWVAVCGCSALCSSERILNLRGRVYGRVHLYKRVHHFNANIAFHSPPPAYVSWRGVTNR